MIAKVAKAENPPFGVDGYDPAVAPRPAAPQQSPAIVRTAQLDLYPSHRGRWTPQIRRQVLQRYVEGLADRPYCAEDFDAGGTLIRPAGLALEHSYVQYNRPWERRWVWADVDHPILGDHFPLAPSLVLLNMRNGHYQAGWELRTPVLIGPNANPHPIRWADQLERRMITALGADSGHTGLLGKNPISPAWEIARVGRGRYELATLESALQGVEPARRPSLDGSEGRNCALFDGVRHYAYALKGQGRVATYEDLHAAVLTEAQAQNVEFCAGVGGPLPPKEVRHTAKSIAHWTWHYYTGSGRTGADRERDRRRRAGAMPRDAYLALAGDRRSQALLLAADGLSRQQIADRIGVTKRRVQQYLAGG